MDLSDDRSSRAPPGRRVVLFLQGPITTFTRRLAERLESDGHRCLAIHLNAGDALFWRRRGGIAYRGRHRGWARFVAQVMDREGVTDLFLTGEQRGPHRIAIEAARARNIAVVTSDFGYLRPDWLTLELDGMTSCSRFPRDPARIRALAEAAPAPDLSRRYHDSFLWLATWDVMYHVAAVLGWVLYPHHRWEHIHHPFAVYAGMVPRLITETRRHRRASQLVATRVRDHAPYFVFPLQMENDAQIRTYSPYRDLARPIAEVVTSFAAHGPADARLVVKLHPLDPGVRDFRGMVERAAAAAGVGERVDWLDGGDLEALLRRAAGVVTINSTVGLAALRLNRPVVTLGDAIYNVEGLVRIGDLDGFWRAPRPPDAALRDAFVRALAATVQIRGVYHCEPGLAAAVDTAAARIGSGRVNALLDAEPATPRRS